MTQTLLLEHPVHPASPRVPKVADADHLGWLESESIHILREVAGQCSKTALLFSGGKD
jgi:sulfate adenylyltransferase subunit 2